MSGAATPAEVWIWSLDVASPDHWLSEDETARAARFVTSTLQQRWAASRAGMRGILGAALNRPPESFQFGAGEHGRPFLVGVDCPYSFNLSHSGGLAALVICEDVAGVDIESIQPLTEDVESMFFSQAEIATLSGLGERERMQKFYRFWTAKEAVLKALGSGFSVSGKSFTVDLSTQGTPALVEAHWENYEVGSWRLVEFQPAEGFAGALAVRTNREIDLTVRRWAFPS